MNQKSSSERAGFTLIELMIVVTLIGILSSVAIPGFQGYQRKSKRAEAYTNLSALAKTEKSYYAEMGNYVSVLGEPITTSGVAPSSLKRNSAPVAAAFQQLGWAPDGNVYYDYDACAPGGTGCSCSCASCFTVSAWGDLDDDGTMSAYMYFEADSSGNVCQSAVGAHFPPVHADGGDVLQSSAWHGSTDDF